MDKLLPLLSESFHKILEEIKADHESKIAQDLLNADDYIWSYNQAVKIYTKDLDPYLSALSHKIDTLINDTARLITARNNEFELSFLPKGKEPMYNENGTWRRENRQSSRPVRVIKKLLVNKYNEKQFEDFNNVLKSVIFKVDFAVISGEDIRNAYLENNYVSCTGTLGDSCMRYEDCQSYFDIYVENAKMLVALENGLVAGRAIVWELGDITLMDRIYTCKDYLVESFIDYAITNHWFYCKEQKFIETGDTRTWTDGDKEYVFDDRINLPRVYDHMPYMDSFRYYDQRSNYISLDPKDGTGTLDVTDGEYLQEEVEYYCNMCGTTEISYGEAEPLHLHFSFCYETYFCEEHAHYDNRINDWVPNDAEMVDVHIAKNGIVSLPKEHVLDNLIDPEFIKANLPSLHRQYIIGYCEIGGQYYDLESGLVEYSSSLDKFIVNG